MITDLVPPIGRPLGDCTLLIENDLLPVVSELIVSPRILTSIGPILDFLFRQSRNRSSNKAAKRALLSRPEEGRKKYRLTRFLRECFRGQALVRGAIVYDFAADHREHNRCLSDLIDWSVKNVLRQYD